MAEKVEINTHGRWQPFEAMTQKELEVGHTYKITVNGDCLLTISPNRPTAGMGTNGLTYTKDEVNKLWILTKGE